MGAPKTGIARITLAALICGGMPMAASQAQTVVNGTIFGNPELVGVGRLAANLRDAHAEMEAGRAVGKTVLAGW